MQYNELTQKYSPYLRQYFVPLILAVLGLIFLGYGLIGYFVPKRDTPDILFEAASDSAEPDTLQRYAQNRQQKQIFVDVEGAVEKPGVYKLAVDSRMQDALIAAGGLGRGADREVVAKNLNLAAKLIDGMKVYVPYEGDKTVIVEANIMVGDKAAININSASEQELDSLPGVGKTTADKIVSNRPYETIEVLVERKIVGQKVFEQIKDKIVAQ